MIFKKFREVRKLLKEKAELIKENAKLLEERDVKQSCTDQMQQVKVIDKVGQELLKERDDLRARLSKINVELEKIGIIGMYSSRKRQPK